MKLIYEYYSSPVILFKSTKIILSIYNRELFYILYMESLGLEHFANIGYWKVVAPPAIVVFFALYFFDITWAILRFIINIGTSIYGLFFSPPAISA
jgi:hypothetical protein